MDFHVIQILFTLEWPNKSYVCYFTGKSSRIVGRHLPVSFCSPRASILSFQFFGILRFPFWDIVCVALALERRRIPVEFSSVTALVDSDQIVGLMSTKVMT